MKSGSIMNPRISKYLWQVFSIPIVIGALLSLSSCGNSSAESTGTENAKPNDVIDVSVITLKQEQFSEDLKLSGTVESFQDVKIAAEEGGELVKWIVPKGGRVSKGSVIGRLDSAIARASFDAANAQYKLAEVTYQKQKKVFEQQAISELQIKTFEYQRDAAKAQADLAKARLENTIIRSPMNGVLNDRFVEEGEMVGPGIPVAHVVNTDRLKVAGGVPERYVGRLALGDKVTFTADAFPGETFRGTISFISAAVNPDNRSILTEVTVANAGGKLKPDMIVTLRLTLKAIENAIVVPTDYIQQVDLNKYVVYTEQDGVAQERVVTVGSTSNGNTYISKGLKPGERMITTGFQNVSQGQKVNVK